MSVDRYLRSFLGHSALPAASCALGARWRFLVTRFGRYVHNPPGPPKPIAFTPGPGDKGTVPVAASRMTGHNWVWRTGCFFPQRAFVRLFGQGQAVGGRFARARLPDSSRNLHFYRCGCGESVGISPCSTHTPPGQSVSFPRVPTVRSITKGIVLLIHG